MATPLRARLGKLAPALSAKERFLLLLKTHNAGEPEDPALRRTMPRNQVKAFNRYVHLAYAGNSTLGPVLFALSVHAEGLGYALERIGILDKAAAQLEEEHPETLRPPAKPRDVTVPGFLRALAKQLRTDLRRDLSLRWRELRALETVWAEIAQEFEGEPVTDANVRKLADETKEKLQAVASVLVAEGESYRLPAPNQAFVDQVRDVVRQAYERMGWVEPDEPNPGRRANGRQQR